MASVSAVAVALPLSFVLGGSSQAAPTLTVAQAQSQLSALQTKEDIADEAFDAGTIAANQAAAQATRAQAAVNTQSLKLAAMQRSIASFAAASYKTGGLNPTESLLSGGNPATMLSRAANMNEVARSQNGQLIAIGAQKQALAGAEKTASDKASDAHVAVTKLAAAKKQISAVIAQEQAVLSHLQAEQRAALLAAQARAQAASRAEARAALAKAIAATAPAAEPAAATHSGAAPAPVRSAGPVPPASGAAHAALEAAYSQMGKPYAYGGAGPSAYDCSGLTMWSYARAGISLPHSAAGQYGYGTHVSRSQLQPGDLVFYDEGGSIGHVGIYVGNGEMIDANHTGGWVGVRPLYSGYAGATRL